MKTRKPCDQRSVSKIKYIKGASPFTKLKIMSMKKAVFVVVLTTVIGVFSSQAQRVRVRLDFPVGIAVAAPRPPFADAVWVGPEWGWRDGRYSAVPGYWAHPRRHRGYWMPGRWENTRRGYYWRRGYWR